MQTPSDPERCTISVDTLVDNRMTLVAHHMRHIQNGHRIGAFHPRHRTCRQALQSLARTQHRQRTFQPDTVDQNVVGQVIGKK